MEELSEAKEEVVEMKSWPRPRPPGASQTAKMRAETPERRAKKRPQLWRLCWLRSKNAASSPTRAWVVVVVEGWSDWGDWEEGGRAARWGAGHRWRCWRSRTVELHRWLWLLMCGRVRDEDVGRLDLVHCDLEIDVCSCIVVADDFFVRIEGCLMYGYLKVTSSSCFID